MKIQFWGTRGSIAKAGASTVRYGGNTSCVEVRSANGTLVVIDCGTGAHGLGCALMAEQQEPVNGNILISHTHWDHIQGLPFFAPLRSPGNEWDIYAPRGLSQSLRDTLSGQMQYTYFPITLEELGASLRYHDLVEGGFQVGDIRVHARYLNHPALTLGYRLQADGVAVVYACDHEPHGKRGPEAPARIGERDRGHADFLQGADLVIHDAQYTDEEYPQHVGWGHSTIEYSMELCMAAGVKRLAFTHHDPLRDDDALDRLLEEARRRADMLPESLEIFAAAEGMMFELESAGEPETPVIPKSLDADAKATPAMWSHTLLLASDAPGTSDTVLHAARAEGFKVVRATDGAGAMVAFQAEPTSLIVANEDLPSQGALALCREIRKLEQDGAPEVPFIVLGNSEPMAVERDAGITDWLAMPCSKEYARTRLRAWALRNACQWMRAPLPKNEAQRLAALQRLCLLDSEPEERFDRLTRIAATAFDAPMAFVTMIDSDRQWFKSRVGLDATETSRDAAFCAHAILDEKPMIVPDALLDSRFAENPVVLGDPRVRFYAGIPLSLPDGHCIGTLCVVDVRPRQPDPGKIDLLRDLAQCVEQELAVEYPA